MSSTLVIKKDINNSLEFRRKAFNIFVLLNPSISGIYLYIENSI